MLPTITTPYEPPLRPMMVPPPFLNMPTSGRIGIRDERKREAAVDETLAESFPASDPPSWNPGLARLSPLSTSARVIDVAPPDKAGRAALRVLASLAGAVGIALLVPVAILLVGLPVALAVRGLHDLLLWLAAALG